MGGGRAWERWKVNLKEIRYRDDAGSNSLQVQHQSFFLGVRVIQTFVGVVSFIRIRNIVPSLNLNIAGKPITKFTNQDWFSDQILWTLKQISNKIGISFKYPST